MTRFSVLALGCFWAISASGQAKLEFEVASVRPADPPQQGVTVGLRLDGSQAHIAALPMRDYIAMAYRVRPDQVTAPDWATSTRFDLSAKLPDGSNADQVPDMLQSLLAARFGLKFHHEQKEQPVYVLTVKPPLKLEKSAQDPGAAVPAGVRSVTGTGTAEGVSVDLGGGSYYIFKNNQFEIKKVTMDTLARLLERYLDRPLLNMTGLEGVYDLTLTVTQEDYYTLLVRAAVNSGVTNLPSQAMQLLDRGSISSLIDGLQQLGLKLEARKEPLDMIVVDQVSKAPSDN